MKVIDDLHFIGEDERIRKFLLPVKIVKTTGCVINEEKLLRQKSMQIGISETEYTVLQNAGGEEKASVLLDFGVELHGGIRLMNYHVEYKGYPNVRLTFGESVTEAQSEIGMKNAGNDHAVRQFDVPVPAFSDQDWGQTGFRFVKIELLSENARIELKSALAVFIFRDYQYKGSFECDDPVINRIYDTAVYTCHLNLQNMVWDGIKRDRLVWIGDMMPESMAIRDVFGQIPLVEQSLDFVRDQTPLPNWMCTYPSYSMWWLLILWDWYMATGNNDFLEKNRVYATGLLENICDHIADDGTDSLPSVFLDWPTCDTPSALSGVRSLLRMALDVGILLCGIYGEKELAERCENRRKTLDLQSENHFGAKQTAAFMALSGVMEKTAAAEMIINGETKGLSTFLLYFMLLTAAEGGRGEQALSLMKKYLNEMLQKGGTTFWEDYNSEWFENSGIVTEVPEDEKSDIHGDFGAFCYRGFRHSLCHGWACGAVPFLTDVVLGVKIVEPGCKSIEIKPDLCGLKWARGVYPTPYGNIEISHTLKPDGTVETKVTAPKEIKITVVK